LASQLISEVFYLASLILHSLVWCFDPYSAPNENSTANGSDQLLPIAHLVFQSAAHHFINTTRDHTWWGRWWWIVCNLPKCFTILINLTVKITNYYTVKITNYYYYYIIFN